MIETRRVGALVMFALTSFGAASLARADAIMPFEGGCPPGLRIGISGHAERCLPITCASDGECGRGAVCREVHECFAPRPYHGNGRVYIEEPELRDTVVGACAADRSCAEGTCRTRRQCEPTGATPAWDRGTRRWTGEPHQSASCTVAHGARGSATLCVVLAMLALGWRRSRVRRVRRGGRSREENRAAGA